MGTNDCNELHGLESIALSGNLSGGNGHGSNALERIAAALEKIASALAEGKIAPASGKSSAPAAESPTVNECVNEFLRAKARAGRSDRYLRALRVSLVSFARGRHHTPLGEVTHADLERWLTVGNHWAPRTRLGYLSDVSTLYNFAKRRGLVRENPALIVELPRPPQSAPVIQSPAQVAAALEFARRHDLNLCRCLAVRYFAGLRSAEADRLRERDILPDHIEVSAANSKTRRRRLVTIQAALRAWLALGGSLDFGNRGQRWRAFNVALESATGIVWTHNATRHSFVSYHCAHFRNAAGTALEAGHAEAVLFSTYRELTDAKTAAAFWDLRPECARPG